MDTTEFSNLPDVIKIRIMNEAELVLDNEINNLHQRRNTQQFAWENADDETIQNLPYNRNRENLERLLTRGTNIRRIYLQAIERRIETRNWIRDFNRKVSRNLNY